MTVGSFVGFSVGSVVTSVVGALQLARAIVGFSVGSVVISVVGAMVGSSVGWVTGSIVGSVVVSVPDMSSAFNEVRPGDPGDRRWNRYRYVRSQEAGRKGRA